jgi:MYXO-CTERM domain-containing protein
VRSRSSILLIFAWLLLQVFAFPVFAHESVPGRVLLKTVPGADLHRLSDLLAADGVGVIDVSTSSKSRIRFESKAELRPGRYWLVAIDPTLDPEKTAAAFRRLPGVAEATPDYLRQPLFTPNDPKFTADQQNLRQIGLERVWNVTFGAGVRIAVIDTGYKAQGLTDPVENIEKGYDFFGRDDDTDDGVGHGTLVSHVIAEATDNEIGCAGAAPGASILPLKIFPDVTGSAADSDIIDAIDYAVEQGVDIVNMSFGGSKSNPLLLNALEAAKSAGVLLVAAGGNDGEQGLSYPAAYSAVFAVGSCNQHDLGGTPFVSDFSNWGQGLDLVAPGESVLQEGWTPESGYAYYFAEGTSMSAPHVTAVAALMIAAGGPGAPDELEQVLRETAWGGVGGWDDFFGWGEVDAAAAVAEWAGPLPNGPPVAKASAVPSSGKVPLEVDLSALESSDPDGNIISYSWDLDDGREEDGALNSVRFDEPGTFEVELTVTDQEGRQGSDTVTVEVFVPKEEQEKDEGGCGCSAGGKGSDPVGMFLTLLVAGWLYTRTRRAGEDRSRNLKSIGKPRGVNV